MKTQWVLKSLNYKIFIYIYINIQNIFYLLNFFLFFFVIRIYLSLHNSILSIQPIIITWYLLRIYNIGQVNRKKSDQVMTTGFLFRYVILVYNNNNKSNSYLSGLYNIILYSVIILIGHNRSLIMGLTIIQLGGSVARGHTYSGCWYPCEG